MNENIASQRSSFHVTAPGNRLVDEQFAYEYDVDGNQIRKTIKATGKVWLYTYDVFDRLREAVLYASPGGSIETAVAYDYDALDRRIRRVQPSANSEELYFHDGWDIDSLDQRTWSSAQTTRRA